MNIIIRNLAKFLRGTTTCEIPKKIRITFNDGVVTFESITKSLVDLSTQPYKIRIVANAVAKKIAIRIQVKVSNGINSFSYSEYKSMGSNVYKREVV